MARSDNRELSNALPDPETTEAVEIGLEAWLLDLLVCPVDLSPVRFVKSHLICNTCGRHYAVHDGIPVMMPGDPETEHKY